MKPLDYRSAGVDIEAGDEAVRRIAPLARRTYRSEVLDGIGAFASFVRVPAGYAEPVLVSSPRRCSRTSRVIRPTPRW